MLKVWSDYRFWIVAGLLIIIGILHYPQQVLHTSAPSVFTFWGLTRHAAERILLLIPMVYAAATLGIAGGLAAVTAGAAIMLPRVILISDYRADSLFETAGIIFVGIIASVWLHFFRERATNLKNVEKMLAQIIDGSPIPCFSIDASHRVTHWNRALETMSGVYRDEVLGTDRQWRAFYTEKRPVLADLIVDGATDEQISAYYQGRSKKTTFITGAYESEDFLPRVGTDGRWLHFTASPIYDSHGNIAGSIEVLEDIGERKGAEAALQQSGKRFRDLFENALDPIWVYDAEGNILLANRAAAENTGRSLDELRYSNIKNLLTEESLVLAQDIKQRLLNGETIENPYEQKIRHKDGREAVFMVKTNLLSVDNNNAPVTFQSIARDVTEEKRMTENLRYYLQQITRAQEDERKRIARELHDSTAQSLIAILHKLENLLDRIKLVASDTAELWQLHKQTKDVLQEVRGFSRDLRPAVLDDLGLLPALELISGTIKNDYGLETTLRTINQPRRLLAEAELLLFRIAQEALRNAVKHAHATAATVTVAFDEKEITITVSDNGTGFSVPGKLDELTKHSKLGLVGIQERVQLLGGVLHIESAPGKGTSIVVRAPV